MEVDITNLRMDQAAANGSGSASGSRDSIDSSDTYSKYGITNIPKTTVVTPIGQTKTFAGLSAKEWVFLLFTTVNILAAIGLTVYRLVKLVDDGQSGTPDFTFIILLLLNSAFCLFYAYHGVLRERVYEMYALMAAVLVVMVYCIVEYILNNDSRTTLKLIRLILICVLAPPNILLAWSVAKHFGYLQFRIVGASEYLQYLYNQASLFSCLLKFDVQVTASIVVLILRNGTKVKLLEEIILGVGIPYALGWNILGWFVLRKELSKGAIVFAIFGLAKPTYYIYKIVEEYMDIHETIKELGDTIVYSTIAAALLAIFVWIVLMVELYKVYKNFGKGLKERAYDVLATERTSLITGRRIRR
ncbi:uncharacterized protein LOC134717824 [Mytilus trossulus]|uniref:uncharacterized protein LOC134717824 n=1 Tax=Mytilus trossulus TaxID=6551 RepID=UPI003006C159